MFSRGSLGVDGYPRTYSGTTVTYQEAWQGTLFHNLFIYRIPGVSQQSGILKYLMLLDIQIETNPSPLTQNGIDGVSCIATLGSPGHNLVSQWAETELKSTSCLGLITPARADRCTTNHRSQAGIHSTLYDSQSQRYVFYVGGISETACRRGMFPCGQIEGIYERTKKIRYLCTSFLSIQTIIAMQQLCFSFFMWPPPNQSINLTAPALMVIRHAKD